MKKKIIAVIIVAAVAVGAIYGGYSYTAGNKKVEVFPVADLNQEYWGGESESYGMIESKDAQIVNLSGDMEVKEVFVKEGQKVKKGDKLAACEGKMSEREYKLAELDVESYKNQLAIAQNELEVLKNTKPIPDTPIYVPPVVPQQEKPEKPQIEEKKGDAYQYISAKAQPYNKDSADGSMENPYRYLCTEDCYITGDMMIRLAQKGKWSVFEIYKNNKISGDPQSSWTIDGANMMVPAADTKWAVATRTQVIEEEVEEEEPIIEEPEIIIPEGYTKEELASLISEKEDEIKALDISMREAEITLGTMKLSMDDGNIYATISGTVYNLQDLEGYSADNGPLMEVRASDEMQMTGVLSEFMVNKLQPGDSVMIESWNTGNMCSAEITEISEYPTSNAGMYGVDGSSVSYYTFQASVSRDDGLGEGEYVGVKVAESQNFDTSIFLEKAYVRSEGGRYYVYVRNKDNRLEKRYVSTGVVLWGEVIEVTSGISADDYIAFPYGKMVKEGVKAVTAEEKSME